MDYKTYRYSLSELGVGLENVAGLMGYCDEIPEDVVKTYQGEMNRFGNVDEIAGGISVVDCSLNQENNTIHINGNCFSVGEKMLKMFENSVQIAVFICTAGKTISQRSKELMGEGNLLEGYVVDVIGSVVVEQAMDKIHKEFRSELSVSGLNVTNRYSPGYCDWNVSGQKALFSLFPTNFCGVSLTESCLMKPIKSVSGFIGIGRNVQFHQYSCNMCMQQNCIYKGKKR